MPSEPNRIGDSLLHTSLLDLRKSSRLLAAHGKRSGRYIIHDLQPEPETVYRTMLSLRLTRFLRSRTEPARSLTAIKLSDLPSVERAVQKPINTRPHTPML